LETDGKLRNNCTQKTLRGFSQCCDGIRRVVKEDLPEEAFLELRPEQGQPWEDWG
jgi:hypothetical protein